MLDVYAKLPEHIGSMMVPRAAPRVTEITAEARVQATRCEKVVRYCTLVRQHVVEYDSLDTAVVILGRAINTCPSIEARQFLVKANKLLRAAIKASAWLVSKRRARHVDATTRNRNLDRFHDELSEAILLLETETKRNNSSLIDYISSTYQTDLPLTLADSKTFLVRKTPIVVMLPDGVGIDPGVPALQIDTKLWLLKAAHVIGVNTDRVKNKEYDRVNSTVLGRYGCTVYETALRRPSSNINWYLLLDFHAPVEYAGFVDYLEIDTPHTVAEAKLRTERLRDARRAFEHDHADLLHHIAWLRTQLDNMQTDARAYAGVFGELTALSESDTGLTIKEYGHLQRHLERYQENLLLTGMGVVEAKRQTLHQRLAARAEYYNAQHAMGLAKQLRREIKSAVRTIDLHRANRALSLGMVGNRSMMDFAPDA